MSYQRDDDLNRFAIIAKFKKFSETQSGEKYVVHRYRFINKVKSEV